MCIYIYIYIYIHIHIYRERERHMYICMCMCMCVYIYIYHMCVYIYIYTHRERERERERSDRPQVDAWYLSEGGMIQLRGRGLEGQKGRSGTQLAKSSEGITMRKIRSTLTDRRRESKSEGLESQSRCLRRERNALSEFGDPRVRLPFSRLYLWELAIVDTSEGGMIWLETLIEHKFHNSSCSSLSSYWN